MGFKWFVARPARRLAGASAARRAPGASFLRRDGTVWTTDKDGLILDLLAAEITARTGRDPGEHYQELAAELGDPVLHAHRRAGEPRAEGRGSGSCPRPR